MVTPIPTKAGYFDIEFAAFANYPSYVNYVVKGIVIVKEGGNQAFVLQAVEPPHTMAGITIQVLPPAEFLGFMIEITSLNILP